MNIILVTSATSRAPTLTLDGAGTIEADDHRQCDKIVAIGHGNGSVSRNAHVSEVFVREGDLVVRGQRVATVGSTGR